jgi:hypothetical protein
VVDPEIAGFYALGLEAERLWTWGRLEGMGNDAADPNAWLDEPGAP